MISTDLFQTIALALMFIILIALLAVLATLSGLKKSLGTGTRIADTGAADYGDTTSYPSYGGATGETGYGYGAQPAAQPAAAAAPRPEVSTSYAPVAEATQPAAQTAVPATAAAPASTAAPLLTGNEPEEQPFERDGRWWFKRGGDLLVYDEGTGQWVAAGVSGAASAPPAATTQTGYSAPAGEVGEGWRCSSCGAINGSTATVCRMCFTPR